MADLITYIDKQQVLPEVAKDMLAMTGWEFDELECCTKNPNGEIEGTILKSRYYSSFFGNDAITLAVSRNRVVTLIIDLKQLDYYEPGMEKYNYFIKKFSFSDRLTELEYKSIPLSVHKVDKDYMLVRWEYENYLFEVYMPIDL